MENKEAVGQIYRINREELKTLVMDKLKWTELEYCEFQLAMGERYVDAYISVTMPPDLKRKMLASRVFWNWWKNHWAQRDIAFMNSPLIHLSRITRREVYECMNNGRMLAEEIHPGRVVMEESFKVVTHEIVKEQTSKV